MTPLLTPIRSAMRAREALANTSSAIVSTAAATIWSRPPDSVNVRASPAGELTGRSGRPGSKQLAAPLVRSMTRQANQQSTRRLAEQLDHAGRADHSD